MKKCKCGRLIYDFETARKRTPACLLGIDPMQHTTIADLISYAETELENYFGGYNLCDAPDITTKRQLHAVRNYVSALKHSLEPCSD